MQSATGLIRETGTSFPEIVFSGNVNQHIDCKGTIKDSVAIKNLVSDAEALLKSVDEKKYPVIAALVHTTLGNTLNYKTYRYNDAFAHYLKAYNLYKNIPVQQYPDRQYSQYSIALTYYQFGDYENALKLGKEINSLYTEKNHTAVFIVDLIGMCNLRMENFAGAIPYFQWILDNYQQCGVSASWEGIALGNIGEALYLQGRNDEAINYLRKAVTITMKSNVPDNAANFAALLSSIYMKQKTCRPQNCMWKLHRTRHTNRMIFLIIMLCMLHCHLIIEKTEMHKRRCFTRILPLSIKTACRKRMMCI
jgi:tetratricopeptide (TPR) repeat protein